VSQRSPGWRTLGAARYSMAITRLIKSASTGHLAVSQTSTPLEPRPSNRPTRSAMAPVTTTPNAHALSRVTMTSVSTTRSGSVFHTGRPSSIP
jgi:hypothetical protein